MDTTTLLLAILTATLALLTVSSAWAAEDPARAPRSYDEVEIGLHRFPDRVGGARRGHVDDADGGACGLLGVLDGALEGRVLGHIEAVIAGAVAVHGAAGHAGALPRRRASA